MFLFSASSGVLCDAKEGANTELRHGLHGFGREEPNMALLEDDHDDVADELRAHKHVILQLRAGMVLYEVCVRVRECVCV